VKRPAAKKAAAKKPSAKKVAVKASPPGNTLATDNAGA
jgi:hypothetical protein